MSNSFIPTFFLLVFFLSIGLAKADFRKKLLYKKCNRLVGSVGFEDMIEKLSKHKIPIDEKAYLFNKNGNMNYVALLSALNGFLKSVNDAKNMHKMVS
jgi:hypothetical protein